MTKILYITLSLACISWSANAQFGKLKALTGKKDTTHTVVSDSAKTSKSGGPNLWSKVIAKAAKAAGNLAGSMYGLVATTSTLDNVAPMAVYTSNLHPGSVGVVGQSFFEGWEPGGNSVMLSFSSKSSIQLNKIDGSVQIDGKPANYVAMGIYSGFFKDNVSPKLIEVETTSGQKASFTLLPPKEIISVVSINGQKSNISVDLTKDVVIELANISPNEAAPVVLVSITGTTLGIKTFYEVGWFAAKSKITIPAAMFRNMNGATSNIGLSGCYLQVSRSSIEKASKVSGAFPNMEYYSSSTDGKFIDVTNQPAFNKGLVVEGKEKFPKGEISYEIKKSHALLSPNLSRMKKIGVTSFAIQGKTSFYDSKTKYSGADTYTTTTKSAQFPQVSNEVWDDVLDKMYKDMAAIIASELNVEVLPIEKVTQSKGYQSIEAFSKDDENSKSEFARAYKDTKLLIGLRPVSVMAGKNSGEFKIMQETGANATMRATVELNMSYEGSSAKMIPKIIFEIAGEIVGDVMSTTYLSGVITGKGAPIINKTTLTQSMLEDTFLRRSDLMAAFKKGLQEIKLKEQQNGDYEVEWAAMNK